MTWEVGDSTGKSMICELGGQWQHTTGVLADAMDDENLRVNLPGSRCESPMGDGMNTVFEVVLASSG